MSRRCLASRLPACPGVRRSLNGGNHDRQRVGRHRVCLIGEARGAGNPNRRRRLVQEAFKLATRAVRAERKSGSADLTGGKP